jgi:hypothetical protein
MLVKSSEYRKNYEPKDSAKLPGTDFCIYEKPSTTQKKWKDSNLPYEKTTAYSRQYPGQNPESNKQIKDRELRNSFANRNSNIIGNSYASFEDKTNFRKSFVAPEKESLGRGLSRHESQLSHASSARDLKLKSPYGYRSTLDGKTAYSSAFVNHGIKHCICAKETLIK